MMKPKSIIVPEDLKIDIQEVANPDADAQIVAYSVVRDLKTSSFSKRVIKMALDKVMASRDVKVLECRFWTLEWR